MSTKEELETPAIRSASVLVQTDSSSLLIFGGETPSGVARSVTALADTWALDAPATGWISCSCPDPRWSFWECGATANESVPTPRSNHAAVACGDHLLVFGGWADDGNTCLCHPELLHLETRCWTHCSTTNDPPPPRGNPTLVYTPRRHLAILYGGWNRHFRFDDVWCLDMESWTWYRAATADETTKAVPAPRTDHAAVLWHVDSSEERMLVFGGSTAQGASSELWSLDCTSGAPSEWEWSKELHWIDGPTPAPRTSHAAAIAGSGASASLVICGGQDGSLGSGVVAIVADAWVLHPLGSPSRTWHRLAWEGTFPLQRCRHSLAILGGVAIVYGGYDGVSAIDAHHSLFCAPIFDAGVEGVDIEDLAGSVPARKVKQQERWAVERPVTEDDLPEAERERAAASKLPLAMAKALHRHALALEPPRDTYIDPASGYSVFTQHYLKRRPCCGNGCRHCPWGHVNVPH